MVRGLYTAYTGMEAQQQKMDIVSNNLANANTTGFKQDNVVMSTFKEVLAVKINDPAYATNQPIGYLNLGAKVDNIYTNFEQGGLSTTEDALTFAIEGQGFFAIGKLDADGNMVEQYTRDGSFSLTQNGELVTEDGSYVLGNNGIIRLDTDNISVVANGSIYVDNQIVDNLKLVNVEDLQTLNKIGDNIYETTDASVLTSDVGSVRQGYQEASNVNSVKEMIEMINIMRTYEANQRVMTTYDSTLENVVNNVGRV